MERSADSKNIIPTAILNYYLYGKNVVNSVDMRYIHEKEKSSIEQIDNNEELTSVSTGMIIFVVVINIFVIHVCRSKNNLLKLHISFLKHVSSHRGNMPPLLLCNHCKS